MARSRTEEPLPNAGEDGFSLDLRPVILWWPFGAVVLGVVVAGWSAGSAALGTVLLPTLACLACGVAAGFLFGIPKVLQGDRPEGEVLSSTGPSPLAPGDGNPSGSRSGQAAVGRRGARYGLQVNTNLEQISDWLCKIIVGLGLIELRKIPDHIEAMAAILARDLGTNSSHSFACGLLIYFAVSGFLLGYLATRLILSGEFAKADLTTIHGEARQEAREEANRVVEEKLAQEAIKQVQELDLELIVMTGKIAQQQTNVDPHFLQYAIDKLTDARVRAPHHRGAALVLSNLYKDKKRDVKAALKVVDHFLQTMADHPNPKPVDVADAHFSRACYCCLLAFAPTTAETARQGWKEKMYESLKEAFKNKINIAEATTDPDFAAVRNEDEFKRFLEQYLQPAEPAAAGQGRPGGRIPT